MCVCAFLKTMLMVCYRTVLLLSLTLLSLMFHDLPSLHICLLEGKCQFRPTLVSPQTLSSETGTRRFKMKHLSAGIKCQSLVLLAHRAILFETSIVERGKGKLIVRWTWIILTAHSNNSITVLGNKTLVIQLLVLQKRSYSFWIPNFVFTGRIFHTFTYILISS